MEWKKWDDALGLPATLLACIGVVLSVFVAGYRWTCHAFRTVRLAVSFRSHFGDDPAAQIRDLLDRLRHFDTEATVRFEIVSRHLDIGIYVCSADGRCSYTNDVTCEIFERDSHSLIGYGWLDAIEGDERIRVFERWDAAVKNQLPYSEEYWIRGARSGNRVRIRTKAYAGKVDGQVICFIGYVERVNTEEL